MWRTILIWLCIYGCCAAVPYGKAKGGKRNMPIIQREEEPPTAAMENEAVKPEAAATAANTADDSEAAASSAAVRPPQNMHSISTLTLPSNATSIRADITDGFSCANRSYGYYADVENDCQIFHVCLPVTYINGKENIFRWSFICPEETIFSQDSFTCMRHEDMTIDCEDSYQYYELNRNFGVIEEENASNKHSDRNHEQHKEQERPMMSNNNKNNGGQHDQLTAMTQEISAIQPQRQPLPPQQTQTQPQLQPQPHLEAENSSAEKVVKKPTANGVAATMKPKPAKPTKSPKPSKPNRRKPATQTTTIGGTLVTKKKPLRKATTTTTTAPPPDATTLMQNFPVEDNEAAKPTNTPPRFTKRPIMSTNLKEKLQPTKKEPQKPDTIPIRIELYNQKRKRPAFMNKKDATTTVKTVEVAAEALTTEQIKLAAATTTATPKLAMTTMSTTTSEKQEAEVTVTIDNVASQASETSEVFVKPEVDLNKKVSKPTPTEPEVATNLGAGNLAEMPAIKPLEAFVEIPAVITEVEETNTNEVSKPVEEVEESQPSNISADAAVSIEEQTHPAISVEEAPAIFQQNSEEATQNNNNQPSIEEMENEKPADAPELVVATAGMAQQQPMVEEMFGETVAGAGENDENNKHTMGGFKPVDPAMAAEAEALIANFLNTLMKSEQVNKPSNEPAIAEPQAYVENETEKENAEKTNKNEATKTTMTAIPIKAAGDKKDEEANQEAVAAPSASVVEESSPESPVKNEPLSSSLPSIMMMHSHHQPVDMFQIPVQVIQTPVEVPTVVVESKPTAKPFLSIDDVVELVKEQLDQKPTATNEAGTQTQTLVEPAAELPMTSLTTNDESKYQKLGQELILPIYQRVASNPEPQQQMLKAPHEGANESEANTQAQNASLAHEVATTNETESKNEGSTAAAATTTTKAARAERARSIKTKTVSKMSLDPRKRRFLFRSDAS